MGTRERIYIHMIIEILQIIFFKFTFDGKELKYKDIQIDKLEFDNKGVAII